MQGGEGLGRVCLVGDAAVAETQDEEVRWRYYSTRADAGHFITNNRRASVTFFFFSDDTTKLSSNHNL